MAGSASSLSLVETFGPVANLHRFVLFDLATSLGFDLPRPFVAMAFLLTVGPAVLRALRRLSHRVSRKALFIPESAQVGPGRA